MVSWVDGRSKGLEGKGIEEGGTEKRGGGKEGGKERWSDGGDEMRNTCNI